MTKQKVNEKKKVAILGTVPHKMMAPFKDEEFEIWAIAHACLGEPLPKVDRIFEVHPWEEVIKWKSDLAWKIHPNIPVYLREARTDVKGSITFPFEYLAKKYNIFDDRKEVLFTNSISEMIVLAVDEGFEEIHVYGVNMSHNTEYGTQKPSCEYFLGLAKGKGIKIHIPTESDLCKSFFIYGKQEEENQDLIKKIDDRIGWAQGCINGANQNGAGATNAYHQFYGRVEELKEIVQILSDKDKDKYADEINLLMAKGSRIAGEMMAHQNSANQFQMTSQQMIGVLEDCKYWRMTLIH